MLPPAPPMDEPDESRIAPLGDVPAVLEPVSTKMAPVAPVPEPPAAVLMVSMPLELPVHPERPASTTADTRGRAHAGLMLSARVVWFYELKQKEDRLRQELDGVLFCVLLVLALLLATRLLVPALRYSATLTS